MGAMALRALHIIGLALNVIGAGIIFMWAYLPDDKGAAGATYVC